jgi:simple sugar transport system permease protein
MSGLRGRLVALTLQVVVPLVLALGVGAIFIACLGKNPLAVYATLVEGTLLRPYDLGQVIYKTSTLIFTGLAVAVAFRAGLFNIGAEGQLYLGAFAAALAGLYVVPLGVPAPLAPWVCGLAACAGGVLAAAVPAVLRAWRGAHEVIVTIMMNFVIIHVVNFCMGYLAEPGTVHTARVPEAARLDRLDLFPGSAANPAIFVAVTLAAVAAVLIARTRTGYEMRAVGYSASAAEAGGVRVRWTLAVALLVSGGIAGLGGINFVLGNPTRPYFEQGFSAGAGFLGIAVALLGRNHPLAVVPAAFLFAVLSEGAVAVGVAPEVVRVPRETFEILQAIVILFVITGATLVERWLAAGRPER